MAQERKRLQAYAAINRLPLDAWVSFGDVCKEMRLSVGEAAAFLREAKRLGYVEYYEAYVRGTVAGKIFNGMWRRVKEVEMPR